MDTLYEPNYSLVDAFLILYGVLLGIGLVLTLTFFLALFRGRKILLKWPFYVIVICLTITDILFFIVEIAFIFPDMLKGRCVPDPGDYASDDATTAGLSPSDIEDQTMYAYDMIDLVTDKAVLYFTLLMAINRFSVFVVTRMQTIFSSEYVNITLMVCILVIGVVSVFEIVFVPKKTINLNTSTTTSGSAFVNADIFYSIATYIDYFIPFVIVAIYISIYFALQRKRRLSVVHRAEQSSSNNLTNVKNSKTKDDRKLLLQSLLVALFLQMTNILIIVSDNLVLDDGSEFILYMCATISSVFNHAIHAVIFLCSNATVRSFLPFNCFKKHFHFSSASRTDTK